MYEGPQSDPVARGSMGCSFLKLCNKQILGKTEESLCWSSDERPCGRIQMIPNLETVLEATIVILYQLCDK